MKKVLKSKKIIFLIVATFLIGFVVYFSDMISATNGTFSPEAWNKYPKLRSKMIDDMESRYNIMNFNHDEIVELLGTNEAQIYDDVIIYFVESHLLGKYYYIWFDSDGKVKDKGIVID